MIDLNVPYLRLRVLASLGVKVKLQFKNAA